MLYPSLDTLMRMVDSKYTLVVTAAKRAREITEGKTYIEDIGSVKPVTIALHEIAEGRVTYERVRAAGGHSAVALASEPAPEPATEPESAEPVGDTGPEPGPEQGSEQGS
ncbi:MAG: DNA-directed RNA polymerase subunit omega [Firmicutes bacterium]|nr:DNA-directed RNA polymerase subunit omega [Bacillota bacterium]